jgi:hypothetical protein
MIASITLSDENRAKLSHLVGGILTAMAEVNVGELWQKSDHERITVDGVDGDTVSATLSDTKAHTTAVWIGSRADFDAFQLVEKPHAD